MSRQADSRLRNAGEQEPRRRAAAADQAEWRGYINVTLTAEKKEQFDDWAKTDDVWLALKEAVADGCQVGLKYVGAEETFLASLVQRTTGHVNAGLCVTARSRDSLTALLRVLFLYRVLGSSDSWEEVQGVADPDRW